LETKIQTCCFPLQM